MEVVEVVLEALAGSLRGFLITTISPRCPKDFYKRRVVHPLSIIQMSWIARVEAVDLRKPLSRARM